MMTFKLKTNSRIRSWRIALLILLSINSAAFSGDDLPKFTRLYDSILKKHVEGGLVDYRGLREKPEMLNQAVDMLDGMDLTAFGKRDDQLAFWINAYNILVLHSVVAAYPIASPMEVKGFFDRKKHDVGNERLTLNDIENKIIRPTFKDARIHFALVCAAKGCPILIANAYVGDSLSEQLNARTKATLNDEHHVRVDRKSRKVYVSEIFKWYEEDFVDNDRTVIDYINQYRNEKIPRDYSLDYIQYDWTLNDKGLKTSRLLRQGSDNMQVYTPSALLKPGDIEIRQFNNLYTQTAYFNDQGDKVELPARSTFFTGITNIFYGLSQDVDLGIGLYFKSVRNASRSSSPFSVFSFGTGVSSRTALSSVSPSVKFTPFRSQRNLAIQTGLFVPLANNLEGANGEHPFLDYDDLQWWAQGLFDYAFNDDFLTFVQVGFLVRFDVQDPAFTTPFKFFLNYYPSFRWTMYLNAEVAPSWSGLRWSGYSSQLGFGVKYQVTSNMEIESLSTIFPRGKNNGAGVSYNLGLVLIP